MTTTMSADRKVFFGLGLLVCLNGCTTTDPYTGEQTVSKTTIGAGLGAASGAVIGALAGKGTGALIGAGVGATVGGIAGTMMDRQADALRQQLRDTGVHVIQDRQTGDIHLVMPGDITFATNSVDIKAQFYPVLNSVSLVLRQYHKTVIRIDGYTDSTGSATYNQTLSEHRAASVGQYLSSQGISTHRIVTRGFGQRQAIASNKTQVGRAENRRVEIIVHAV